jgi:hypothetical protein
VGDAKIGIRKALMLKHKGYSTGNSLVEWGLPVLIVGLVLLGFSSTMIPAFRGFLGSGLSSSPVKPTDTELQIRTFGKNPYLQPVTLKLASGKTLVLDSYPLNTGKMLEVAGTNGTTGELLATMRSLARQLLEQGEITQAEYNQMEALANAGHQMAEMERFIEDAIASANGDNRQFFEKPVQFNGREYQSTYHLSYQIAWVTPAAMPGYDPNQVEELKRALRADGTKTSDLFEDSSSSVPGASLQTFYQQYVSLNQKGVLRDPTVKRVVKDLTERIGMLASSMENNLSGIAIRQNAGANVPLSQFNQMMISDFSHIHSAGICNAGGGHDSGVQCPKTIQ